ncbi:transposase [Bacteroides sp. BFG-606]|uniref:transposase n=1 Tax=Bacteroides sp. BFG-606 TaxID=2972763 RepID=UPI002165373A|nr:transposase [Bacteroides sp. BFG-606]MCS2335392.1 transposase [Bacteroides sp. BFG-606]
MMENEKQVFIPQSFLLEKGVKYKTIEMWIFRKTIVPFKYNDEMFYNYDSIPAPTRAKLPSKEAIIRAREREKDEGTINEFYERLLVAKDNYFPTYREVYLQRGLSPDKVLENSQKHAVLEEILTIRDEHREEHERFPLRYVWQAFCKIYPNWYVYHAFSLALNTCVNEGIERLLIKKYVPAEKKFDARYDKMILDCMSSMKKYTQPKIHKKICKACDLKGWEKPSLSWTKQTCVRLEAATFMARNGATDFYYNRKPYMGLIPAQNANSQWQIDGWRLPFYMKDFETLTLFWVIDACTGRIVGSYVDSSENTETILKGLENAVETTGVLPFEIVSDNHSFNQTKEAEHLKNALTTIGVHWTVSMNPRRKSKVERSFRTFGDDFCKEEYGYIGQGIKSKMKNGRSAQEMIDKAVKKPLIREQIALIAGRCIEEYNNTKGKDGKSPNERYEEAVNDSNRIKKSFKVTELDRIALFVRRSEATVRRGQIVIERGGMKYEFELNAKQFNKFNNRKFGVRYATFDEIYLFDLEKDTYIDTVQRKKYAHSALADQTEEDKTLQFKHKGRLNGIDNEVKKAQVDIYNKAVSIDPEAAYIMNPLLTPKADFNEYLRNGNLADFAERHGIRPQDMPEIPVYCEKNSIEPEDKKKNKKAESPFLTDETIDLSRFDY